ncbi:hypothetical protein V493_08063 [Pseudogymnoascus sp. VKM F-4281 (FW-2241)]|nr:hypothetical protein V493_08063 [Pseudogymnoascus sp. VKM F-4281 (FW-2241)]
MLLRRYLDIPLPLLRLADQQHITRLTHALTLPRTRPDAPACRGGDEGAGILGVMEMAVGYRDLAVEAGVAGCELVAHGGGGGGVGVVVAVGV